MYANVYKQLLSASGVVDAFKGSMSASLGGEFLVAILTVVVLIVVQLFIVQWLWNHVLVRVLSVAKPIPNLMYTFGLLVLIAMVLPGGAE